jgi:hypothetical protein
MRDKSSDRKTPNKADQRQTVDTHNSKESFSVFSRQLGVSDIRCLHRQLGLRDAPRLPLSVNDYP